MDEQEILNSYREKYKQLTEQHNPQTIEGSAYRQISELFDAVQGDIDRSQLSPEQASLKGVVALRDVGYTQNHPIAKRLFREAFEDFRRDTGHGFVE